MVSGIERSIIALDLDSQAQLIALTNAIEMQLESGAPVAEVVNVLGDALLALARERRLHQAKRKDLTRRISVLNKRVDATAGAGSGR